MIFSVKLGLIMRCKAKYDIDPELMKGSGFRAPVYRWVLFFASLLLRFTVRGFDKKKVVVKDYKIGKTRFHVVTPINLAKENTPCIFYIHGGGFLFREAWAWYKYEEKMAIEHKCRVIGIDYGLAPKHKFPYQLSQCLAVYQYFLDNKEDLRIDENRIILMGDSAGGSLVIDTILRIGLENIVKPKGAVLIYPVVDNEMKTESMKKYIDSPIWGSRNNQKMWKFYLGGKEYISPLKKDLSNFPKTYIELTEFDCLHDEGMALYHKLKDSGVDVVVNDTKGTYHGYDIHNKARVTIDSINKRTSFIKEIFQY